MGNKASTRNSKDVTKPANASGLPVSTGLPILSQVPSLPLRLLEEHQDAEVVSRFVFLDSAKRYHTYKTDAAYRKMEEDAQRLVALMPERMYAALVALDGRWSLYLPRSSTTLIDALSTVAQLRAACCSGKDNFYMSDSPLKVMRLVCKPCSSVMMSAVKQYTFLVDGGGPAQVEEQIRLLSSTKLSILGVRITACEDSPPGQFPWSGHRHQIYRFSQELKHPLSTVLQLEINANVIGAASLEVRSMMFLPLVQACPALLVLKLAGDPGQLLLAECGARCNQIFSLQLTDVPSSVMKDVGVKLPKLTHACIPAPSSRTSHAEFAPQSCLHLCLCASLTHLDVDVRILTPSMWDALPAGLRKLRCSAKASVPVGMRNLPNLKHLCLCCHSDAQVELWAAECLVVLAPRLKSLDLCVAGAAFHGSNCVIPHLCVDRYTSRAACTGHLKFLNQREQAGLEFTTTFLTQGPNFGAVLSLANDQIGTDPLVDTPGFVASLPPLPGFRGLILEKFEAKELFSILPALAVTFTNISTLVIDMVLQTQQQSRWMVQLQSSDLTCLGACSVLKHLYLESVQITPHQILMLCPCLKALEFLRLFNCAKFSDDDWRTLRWALKVCGYGVQIFVRHHDDGILGDR